jgi:4-hydroxybenzoate polyprenyltransferase
MDGERATPLVVDLDGTLLKTNSLDEQFLATLRANPFAFCKLTLRVLAGGTELKAFLVGPSASEIETWPVRQDFLDYVKSESEAGRQVVLATAADQSTAEAVARRFPFISEIIGSDGASILTGRTRAERLVQYFPNGFIYAGNSIEDLPVWREAADSIIVNAPAGLVRRVGQIRKPRAVFPRAQLTLTKLKDNFRLHQWIKNTLVFVPLVLGGKANDPSAWLYALLGFFALGFAASATYIINDIWDLPDDRRHWSKKSRPLASGDQSIRSAILFAIAGLVLSLCAMAYAGLDTVALLGSYIVGTLSYTFWLKRLPILDVLTLATLFTLRLGLGVALTDVQLSPWLFVFSMFAFLSLSLAKRHTEVLRLTERGLRNGAGRGYVASDAPLTLGLGLASMLGAVLIMILYLIEDAFPRQFYNNPTYLWVIPPSIFFFFARIWLLSQRGQLHDDPVVFALKDRVILILAVMVGISFVAAVGRP